MMGEMEREIHRVVGGETQVHDGIVGEIVHADKETGGLRRIEVRRDEPGCTHLFVADPAHGLRVHPLRCREGSC